MAFDIVGKVALVTGGASGLGYEIVRLLLEKGVKRVAFLDIDGSKGRKAENEFKKKFGNDSCIFIETDVSEETQMKAAFEQAIQTFQQLDIVINNAAILAEMDWKSTIRTNLGGYICGTLLAIEDYLPKYKKGEEGIIVNVASIAGVMPFGVCPIYSCTKHGIVALSRSFGQEQHYKRTKVKVITICPGHMTTPMVLEAKMHSLNLEYCLAYNAKTSDYPLQPPEFVAEEMVKIMTNSTNGSVWVVDRGEAPYEVVYPKLWKDQDLDNK